MLPPLFSPIMLPPWLLLVSAGGSGPVYCFACFSLGALLLSAVVSGIVTRSHCASCRSLYQMRPFCRTLLDDHNVHYCLCCSPRTILAVCRFRRVRVDVMTQLGHGPTAIRAHLGNSRCRLLHPTITRRFVLLRIHPAPASADMS